MKAKLTPDQIQSLRTRLTPSESVLAFGDKLVEALLPGYPETEEKYASVRRNHYEKAIMERLAVDLHIHNNS